jgi:hypothetical protein
MRSRALPFGISAVSVAIACGETLEIAETEAGPDAASTDGGPAADVKEGDACATATWLAQPDGALPYALALNPEGRLFAGGSAGAEAWLAEVDRCDGGIMKEIRFAVADTAINQVLALVATDTEIHAAGGAGNVQTDKGMYARSGLALDRVEVRTFPGDGISSFSSITRADDGTVWLAGGKAYFQLSQTGWGVRLGSSECEFAFGDFLGAIVPNGGPTVVAVAQIGEKATLVEIPEKCEPTNALPPLDLLEQGLPLDIVAEGDARFVVGSAGGKDKSQYGYVASWRGGAWTAARVDPTPTASDDLSQVATDGVALFAAGRQNATFTSGAPTLYRFELPLGVDSVPKWKSLAFGSQLLFLVPDDVKVGRSGDDALFVAGASRSGDAGPPVGAIARCRKSSGCDPN